MPAQIIDGSAIARDYRAQLSQTIRNQASQGVKPGLAVLLVGDDPASQVYVRNKIRACEECGVYSVLDRHPADLTQAALLERIDELNRDPNIHGILVQLPLPPQIDSHAVLSAISASKDVDGFHATSAGALMTGQPGFVPCTPAGVMRLIDSTGVPLRGAQAVVVGASNIVGKPAALLLLAAGATVTICNSKTRDLEFHTQHADVLVVAIGRPEHIRGSAVKPGAVVIDVGINRRPDGSLCGDVAFEEARAVAGWITPVPGGVGPMTIAMLIHNTLVAAQSLVGKESS